MTELLNRISVIDDDAVQLRMVGAMLERLGVTGSVLTDDPEVLLHAVRGSRVNAVFLDLNMPRFSGLDIIRALASERFAGVLVLMSGHKQRIIESCRDFARSFGLRVVCVLNKPISLESLRMALEAVRSSAQPESAPDARQSAGRLLELGDIEAELAGATRCLQLVCQPKYEMVSGRIESYEVLARWLSPAGLLSPAHFIPLAVESGRINELTILIYRLALEQNRALQDRGFILGVSVNFSIQTLSVDGIVERLVSIARQCGVEPRRITIEVTEEQVYGSIQKYLDKIIALIFEGFHLSVDDFGTGNSSLTQLKAIPFSELKVDRSFVSGAASDVRSAAIFESSVRLAKMLSMRVVAEGGETKADWDYAKALGCDCFQGFYTSAPLSLEALIDRLELQQTAAL